MESSEFLGGKYRKQEQVVPGPVQTFRAQDAATGQSVFIHRVSMTEEPGEQAALLRLLSAALLRSSAARKLVRDYAEDQGFWYVVTDSEPQCLLLREWLQFEIKQAANTPVPGASASPSQPAKAIREESPTVVKPPAATPGAPVQADPGEFTRMFQAAKPSEPPAAQAPPAPPAGPSRPGPGWGSGNESSPGEFTRFFTVGPNPGSPVSDRPTSVPEAVPPPQAKNEEPGEFTKIFQAQQPGSTSTSSESAPAQRADRFSNADQKRPKSGFVQRPNTPISEVLSKSPEPGEFTRLFSQAPPSPPAPERVQPANVPVQRQPPSPPPEPAEPAAVPKHEPGEYTRLFGPPDPASPSHARTPPPVPQPVPTPLMDDPLRAHQSEFPPTQAARPASHGPSEYTMIISGATRPPSPAAAPQSSGTPAVGGVEVPLAKPSVPAPKIPQAAPPAMPAIKAPQAPAKVTVPAANKKLIVFFVVLGVLAVLLVVLIVLILKK